MREEKEKSQSMKRGGLFKRETLEIEMCQVLEGLHIPLKLENRHIHALLVP